MTDESKKLAMQYFVGKYTTTSSPEDVKFDEFDKSNNQLQTKMTNTYFPYGYTVQGVVQGSDLAGDGLEYSILYGNYENQSHTNTYGYMIVLDENYEDVQVIKNYSNGDNIGVIISLNVGSDGRFFMVEKDLNNYYRFVLLNNILAKSPNEENYQLVMRQTYRFPDQTILTTTKMFIVKHPQEARYLMLQVYNEYQQVYDTLFAIELVVNVGSENEWNTYIKELPSLTLTSSIQKIDDVWASWDEENKLSFKVIISSPELAYAVCRAVFKQKNSDTLTLNTSIVERGTGLNQFDFTQSIIKNFDVNYITVSRVVDGVRTYKIYKITNESYATDYGSLTPKLIATYSNVNLGAIKGIRLTKNQNDIFFIYQNTNTYVGLIVNETIYTSTFNNFSSANNDTLFFTNVQRTYNLFTLYAQCGNYNNFAKLIYIDETNNQDYQNLRSLDPYFATLYNDNGKLIFARTLYNKSVSGQITTSSIQIPHQYLNDISVSSEKLQGYTYLTIYDINDEFVKNEYEEVYVNFANSWSVQNRNDPNNVIFSVPGATRFNQSITGIYDYLLCKSTKYKVNYDDGTYMTQTFDPSQITPIDNAAPWTHRYTWGVYNPTDKNILSIQILSADEDTVYLTIDNVNFGSGKYYTLTQDVYVI